MTTVIVRLLEGAVLVATFVLGYAVVGPLAILLAVLAFIPVAIARRKGQPAMPWWFFGFLLLPVAIVVALFQKDSRRRCPFCAETVRGEAVACPHCQRDLPAARKPVSESWA